MTDVEKDLFSWFSQHAGIANVEHLQDFEHAGQLGAVIHAAPTAGLNLHRYATKRLPLNQGDSAFYRLWF